ncbi:inositol monophosphatase [bacterium]|jgi:myo-inositol-1(or 4)-monophosphatase|nr:inositol monophosphatase [Candidatus Komeilibacteria bacterium]MBT7553408.1 inositol monophosphatase [bacterium]
MYKKELKIAKQVAQQAGKYLGKEFLNWHGKTEYKNSDEAVTRCDKKAEKMIITKLKKYFPTYSFLGEESGLTDKKSDYFWTIDPLDGTNNFIHHNPNFTVSIALLYKNEVILGVTYAPILNEMYWAVKNEGAYKNNKPIHISKIKVLNKAVVCYNHGRGISSRTKSFKAFQHFQINAYRSRNYFSTTLQMAMVAAGHLDVYMVPKTKLWDVAAGIILLQESGAQVTDWKNKDWKKSSTSILAANKPLHTIMLKEFKKLRLA